MSTSFRCDCPITSALDVLGDKWVLVIVKQMLLEDALTFKDFIGSPEAIATNILSSKLRALEDAGLIQKRELPGNRKSHLYVLTESGLALAPIIIELASWSDRNLRWLHPGIRNDESTELLRGDKYGFTLQVQRNYREKLERLGVELE